jgi:electron transport complex protein RnfG
VNKDGGDVDAITASTITTRAFLNAVNAAYAAYSGQNVDGMSGATEQAAAKEEKCDTEAAKTCGGDCEHDHK